MTTIAPASMRTGGVPHAEPSQRSPLSRSAAVECDHCGLPVPAALVDDASEHQFCCAGCKLAYETIHSCGLGQYYALRERLGVLPTPAGGPDRSSARPSAFVEFDDPAFLETFARPAAAGGQTPSLLRVELLLEGVHCAACIWLVERLPRVLEGVKAARLDLRRAVVELEWDPAVVKLSRIAAALASLGYRPHPVVDSSAQEARRRQDRQALARIGVAAACTGNAMLLAFALYSGEAAGMHPAYTVAFMWLSALIGILSLVWPGRVFLDSAIGAIRARTWHLDTPIAAALVIGNAAGLVAAIRGQGDVFADSLTMLVFLLLVGRWLQLRQQRHALDRVELLFSLTGGAAHLVDADGGAARDVAVQSLRPGHIIEVRPQETIPIDGVILGGTTAVDVSILTGESRPQPAGVGDSVVAGSMNLVSTVKVRVAAVGRDTRAGRMMATIEELSRSRTPIIGAAHKLAAPFVIVVTALSILTFALHIGHGLEPALRHAIALMVATCPCVVALATPLIVTLAVGRAAAQGVLIKGGETFERLARPGLVVLDKTGTLTTGRFAVLEWHGDVSLRPIVATVERGSTHPIAVALAEGEGAGGADAENAADAGDAEGAEGWRIEHLLGLGLIATGPGVCIRVGSPRWVAEHASVVPEFAAAAVAAAQRRGHTPVSIARNGRVAAVAVLGDRIRDDAGATIDGLREQGWRVAVLSGDDPAVVRSVAAKLGIDGSLVWGGATPEGKQARIEALRAIEADVARVSGRAASPVVMVGDGVNDSAALAAADVGIAVRGGAETSLAAADVYIARGGLAQLGRLAAASRRVLRTIWLSLGIAASYNLVAAGLAVAGVMSPLVAAVLMPISSMTVLAIAIRSRTFVAGEAASEGGRA